MGTLFYLFCTTLPSHIIPFVMFWDFPWRSRKAAMILVVCNVLGKMGASWYCISGGINFRSLELAFAVVGFGIYCCFLRLSFFKLLFTYILIVDYLVVVRGIASFSAVRFLTAPIQGWEAALLCLVLYALTLPLLLHFFRQVACRVYMSQAPRLWSTIWLLPGLFSAMTLLLTNSYSEASIGSPAFLLCRMGLLVCVFVIYSVLLQTLESLQKQVVMEQQLIFGKRMMEMQLEEQKKHNRLIMENAMLTRQFRHDLRHQLTVIQSMAADNPRLMEYIGTLLNGVPAAVTDYCENPTVNAVVSHYAALCRREDIRFTARLSVPAENPAISHSSLCVIFGNLLENAVEACNRMKTGERFVRIQSRMEFGVLTVTADNSFDGRLDCRDGVFYSSKRNAPGIGLSSVRTVARAHGGDLRTEVRGCIFQASVYVKTAKEAGNQENATVGCGTASPGR